MRRPFSRSTDATMLPPIGAQREADADLAAAALDPVGGDAVQAHRREQRGEAAEQRREQRHRAVAQQRIADLGLEAADDEPEARVDAGQRVAHGRREALERRGRAHQVGAARYGCPPRCAMATKPTGGPRRAAAGTSRPRDQPDDLVLPLRLRGDASTRKRRPIGLTAGQQLRANVSFTTADVGLDAVSVSAMSRPAISRMPSVVEVAARHPREERLSPVGAAGAVQPDHVG